MLTTSCDLTSLQVDQIQTLHLVCLEVTPDQRFAGFFAASQKSLLATYCLVIEARSARWRIRLELCMAFAELLHILKQMLPRVLFQATLLLLIIVHHMTLAEALPWA